MNAAAILCERVLAELNSEGNLGMILNDQVSDHWGTFQTFETRLTIGPFSLEESDIDCFSVNEYGGATLAEAMIAFARFAWGDQAARATSDAIDQILDG